MTEIYFFILGKSLSKSEISAKGEKLVKDIASKRLCVSQDKLCFSKTENSKPYFKEFPEFHFNISHSLNGLAIAVSHSPVGIDTELIREVDLRVAERYFTKSERDYIFRLSENQTHRFFEIWTKKEAYIKRYGLAIKNLREAKTENIFTSEIKGFIISVCGELTEEPHIILENLENI